MKSVRIAILVLVIAASLVAATSDVAAETGDPRIGIPAMAVNVYIGGQNFTPHLTTGYAGEWFAPPVVPATARFTIETGTFTPPPLGIARVGGEIMSDGGVGIEDVDAELWLDVDHSGGPSAADMLVATAISAPDGEFLFRGYVPLPQPHYYVLDAELGSIVDDLEGQFWLLY